MRIVVLWEDQRAPGKAFGPDLLLKSCIADDRNESPYADWWRRILPIPKKGKERLIEALREDLQDLAAAGSVVAVLDRDKAHELGGSKRKPACRSQLLDILRQKSPGKYELVLLEDNLETLLEACFQALGRDLASTKPSPNDRDDIFHKVAFRPSRDLRIQVREEVPSFDRLVVKVGKLISGP